MPRYHMLLIDAGRVVGAPTTFVAADDNAALQKAMEQPGEMRGREVWGGNRLVGEVVPQHRQEAAGHDEPDEALHSEPL